MLYISFIASTPTKPQRVYNIGILEEEWKKRYCNQTKAFQNKHYKNETSLSSYVWEIKETGQIPTLTWSVVRTVSSYSDSTKKRAICLHEKLEILTYTT